MTKALGLASERTVLRNGAVPRLMPSIGVVRLNELKANIASFKSSSETFAEIPKRKMPNKLMLDEIALDSRGVWFERVQAIAGFCREHGAAFDPHVKSYVDIENIAKAVAEDRLHWGTEATIGALSTLAQDGQYPRPIVLSPTCKREDHKKHAQLLELLLSAWNEHPEGRQVNGPIWFVASDGEGKRRRALHAVTMTKTLDPDSDLGLAVAHLELFNTRVGEDDVTMDIDYKHIWKSGLPMSRFRRISLPKTFYTDLPRVRDSCS